MKKIPWSTLRQTSQQLRKSFIGQLSIFLISLGIGFLLLLQWRSFGTVRETILRDRNPNIFREIQILKTVTDQLRQEIKQTETKLNEISSQASSLTSLQNEIKQFELFSGEIDVSGPGVRIILPTMVDTVWFVDLQNELVTAGAEALTINHIRITAENAGFRAILPQTLLLGNQVLRPPLVIEAIGDRKLLMNVLLQPGGIIARLQKTLGKEEIQVTEEEKLILKTSS